LEDRVAVGRIGWRLTGGDPSLFQQKQLDGVAVGRMGLRADRVAVERIGLRLARGAPSSVSAAAQTAREVFVRKNN
jgi:hypothetical protein